jgi:hypothetical protein
LGQIHITSETSRHWREATVRDEGDIVLYSDYGGAEFGEFDEVEQIKIDDCVEQVATIFTQSGKMVQSSYAGDTGIFENVWVVPDGILQGVDDEAPPGRFFSGRSIKRSSSSCWSPAPEGNVCCDHPFLGNGPQYFTGFQHYVAKRMINVGVKYDQLDCVAEY